MARLHGIKEVDTDNTYWGVASSLWFNHCPHRCFNCWNDETWERDDSLEIDNDKVVETVLKHLDSYGMKKDLSVLGGEPFSPFNVNDLAYILKAVKRVRPQTRILGWTGYELHVLKRSHFFKEALSLFDVLVCGRYIDELNCHGEGRLYGSKNQYVVDVQSSLGEQVVYIEKGEEFQDLETLFLEKQQRRSLN